MNMDDKLNHGLGDWKNFIEAVEKKFGDNDYSDGLNQLLELLQTETLESYISSFEELQYQLAMHNSNLGNLFFM
jgi:hypothetical protein